MLPYVPFAAEIERQRLDALVGYDLLDTPCEAEFDAAVAIACRLFDRPISTITLVDDHRQWFKARKGLEHDGSAREQSICAAAIHEADMLVVADLRTDERFADNPVVTDAPYVRFYAGVPLCPAGRSVPGIGTLCIMDTKPRRFSAEDAERLHDLAAMVCAIIRARKSADATLRLSQDVRRKADLIDLQHAQLHQAERMAGIGSWRFDLRDRSLHWSDHMFTIHGLPVGKLPEYDVALDFYPEPARTQIRDHLAKASSCGVAFEFESDFITADGRLLRVRSIGEPQISDGRVIAILGLFQDITERYARERQLKKAAGTDVLTGLPNRRSFENKFGDDFVRARLAGEPLGLILLDLDGFKAINDTLGHEAGDDVLRETARRLRSGTLGNVFGARLGGDEFVLLVSRPDECGKILQLAEVALNDLRYRTTLSGVGRRISATIGVALLMPEDARPADLLRRADLALYDAKRNERGTGRLYGSATIIRGASDVLPIFRPLIS